MIDERFSVTEFERCGLDTNEAKELVKLLEAEVLAELSEELVAHFQRIVRKLNSMGHSLRLYGSTGAGDVDYRDDEGEGENYSCKLRLGIYLVVAGGYSDILSPEEAERLYEDSSSA